MDDLKKIRKLLDEALTYERYDEGMDLARRGLKLARTKEILCEIEYFRGEIALIEERPKEAIGHFDRAIGFNPRDSESYNDKALCLAELGLDEEAIKWFDRGIEIDPRYATLYHNKGWILNKVGRHEEAIRCFREALELDPESVVTNASLADSLAKLGDYEASSNFYRRALELLGARDREIERGLRRRLNSVKKKINEHTTYGTE